MTDKTNKTPAKKNISKKTSDNTAKDKKAAVSSKAVPVSKTEDTKKTSTEKQVRY